MVKAVAENGYENLKVRDLVRRAEVSSRAFYELFGGKEDCFIHTYDRIVRRATRRMIAAQAGERDWRARWRLIFDELSRQLESAPDSAGLTLVEAYRAGPACSEHVWQTERTLERVLGDCLARAPGGVVLPPLIVEGIVAGAMEMSRRRLASPKGEGQLGDDLADWALSYVDQPAAELEELDRSTVWRDTTLGDDDLIRRMTGDRALILQATAALAAQHGYAFLTAERIRASARVSRGKFHTHFADAEDCYLGALKLHSDEALIRAARAQVAARSWSGGIYRAIAAYCEYVAGDPFLSKVFLNGDFPPSPTGPRSRERIVQALSDQLLDGAPGSAPVSLRESAASSHAAWALFHHYVLRQRSTRRRNIGATLAYVLLAPAIGPGAAVAAIRNEQ
jgi:AcrR family transcriptional regulator